MNRRTFFAAAGASLVAVSAAGAGAFALTRSPSAALTSWDTAGSTDDPRLRAFGFAILAPNPHNRQPWLIELIDDDTAVVYCDLSRRLPETDPFDRQITIGFGCFLELLRLAAADGGYALTVTLFPDGEPESRLDQRPIAHIRFQRNDGQPRDPLFAHARKRRSNKEPFDTGRPVAAAALQQLARAAGDDVTVTTTADSGQVAALRDLTWRAHLLESTTPRTLMESVRLMRIGKAEIEANPDGIDLGGPMLEVLKAVGLLNRDSLADPASTAFAQGLDMYRAIMGTAMAYIWVATPGNRRLDQLAAGRAWLRINLQATALGIALHPISQALQEFPEMEPLYDDLHGRLLPPGQARVQMLGRLGYGTDVDPSPRWPLDRALKGS
jgi:hypothetical protein